MPRALGAVVLAMLFSCVGVLTPGGAAADAPPAEQALERLQISVADRARMLRGETVSYGVSEHSDRELAVGVALFVAAPLARVSAYLAAGELIAQDPTISAYGLIPDPARPQALPAARFTGGERDEAESLLDAAPGTRFNLSPAEIEALRALRSSAASPARVTLEQVSDEYRRLLWNRWRAYQEGGLAAIAPYARGGASLTDPAAELRSAILDAERIAQHGAQLREALARYPAAQPAGALTRFYWIKRRVQRRPDLSLLHQLMLAGPELVVHVERYFYVGHSYNAAQILTGALAYQNGSVLFATSRFSTDEVLGVGSQLKRAVGRTQLRDEMRKRLEGVRASLSRPVSLPVQSP